MDFQVGVIEVSRRRVLRRSWEKKREGFQIENSTCRVWGESESTRGVEGPTSLPVGLTEQSK